MLYNMQPCSQIVLKAPLLIINTSQQERINFAPTVGCRQERTKQKLNLAHEGNYIMDL